MNKSSTPYFVVGSYRMCCLFPLFLNLFLFLYLYYCPTSTFSICLNIKYSNNLHLLIKFSKRSTTLNHSKVYHNIYLTTFMIETLVINTFWLYLLILLGGDIHLNTGPASVSSSSIDSESIDFNNLKHHLSFAHLNVQSITNDNQLCCNLLNCL